MKSPRKVQQIVLFGLAILTPHFADHHQLIPRPVFGTVRHCQPLPTDLEPSKHLVQREFELVDIGVRSDVAVEIVHELISLRLAESAIRRGEECLESARQGGVVCRDAVLVRFEQFDGFGGMSTAEQKVDVRIQRRIVDLFRGKSADGVLIRENDLSVSAYFGENAWLTTNCSNFGVVGNCRVHPAIKAGSSATYFVVDQDSLSLEITPTASDKASVKCTLVVVVVSEIRLVVLSFQHTGCPLNRCGFVREMRDDAEGVSDI